MKLALKLKLMLKPPLNFWLMKNGKKLLMPSTESLETLLTPIIKDLMMYLKELKNKKLEVTELNLKKEKILEKTTNLLLNSPLKTPSINLMPLLNLPLMLLKKTTELPHLKLLKISMPLLKENTKTLISKLLLEE